ncbi:MAG: hypothetical protein Alpg2KO_00530 [Alphaproteobacteria bacterium]
MSDDDLQTLYPARKVGELTINPWTLSQLIKVGPYLEKLLDRAKELGIELTEQALKDDAADKAGELLRLVLKSLKDTREVILITVGEENEAVVDGLTTGPLVEVLVAIFHANKDDISDFLQAGSEPEKQDPESTQASPP